MKKYVYKFVDFIKHKVLPYFIEKKSNYTEDPYSVFHEKVSVWENYEIDWDGEGGVPPPFNVINNVRDFINRMKLSKVPIPFIFCAGDGEIGFRWKKDLAHASICFLDDGKIVGYCISPKRSINVSLDETYYPFKSSMALTQLLELIIIIFDNYKEEIS